MSEIKFGTDGWRAIIADDYTVENVKRVAEASARWMVERDLESVVIGHDCRFGGALFAQTAARVFAHFDRKVYLAEGFVSTPMVSLGVVKREAGLGVVITASHNPPSYNGYKLKSSFGGPSIPSEVAEVENLIPDHAIASLESYEHYRGNDRIMPIDLEMMYYNQVMEHFDMDTIRSAPFKVAYDGMFGAGQSVMKRILPNAEFIRCEENPSFKGQAPEPIDKNLDPLKGVVSAKDEVWLGLANDGDADRIGMYDENGKFVDSHHILLLLLWYLAKYKKEEGKVVVTFSVTDRMKALAEHFGFDFEQTKIGFKYIAEIMRDENVIVGGEESGGLAVKGHIPERDGIWIGLLILEFMAKSGKKVSELVQEVYDAVGSFAFQRDDLHIAEEKKQEIIANCANGVYREFGPYTIREVEELDGFKFFTNRGSWVMIRPSGTEPVLRVYAQADNHEDVRSLLDATRETITA